MQMLHSIATAGISLVLPFHLSASSLEISTRIESPDPFSHFISLRLLAISSEDGSEELRNIARIVSASPFYCPTNVYTLGGRKLGE